MLGLPTVTLMSIVCFAYSERTRVEPARIEAEHRNAATAQRRALDLQCLAENIYFEARGEPLDGQRAVAEVTLNRTRSPYFPHTICAVVHETQWDPLRRRLVAHFSWTELSVLSEPTGSAWKQAMTVANAAYDDTYMPVVPGALFYHANSIRPDWRGPRPPSRRLAITSFIDEVCRSDLGSARLTPAGRLPTCVI